jgi:Eukaryotic aspartyl protease
MATVLESPVAGLNIYEDSPGPITFGYLDDHQYAGDLTWVDIDTTTGSSWTASTVYFSINGTATTASAGKPAIMGKLGCYCCHYESSYTNSQS